MGQQRIKVYWCNDDDLGSFIQTESTAVRNKGGSRTRRDSVKVIRNYFLLLSTVS